jgi:hypothetical protein
MGAGTISFSYRNIIPRTVPAATSTLKTSSDSKSVRISLMIVTSFVHMKDSFDMAFRKAGVPPPGAA